MSKRKQASASTLARENVERKESYQSPRRQSRLKIAIGEILLLLLAGNTQPDDWQQFDRLLRQFYEGSNL